MLPANERDVAMVFQYYAVFPHMTSLENVAYGLQSSGLGRKEAREKAEEGLQLVGLAGMGHRLPAELSGGSSSAWPWHAPWSSSRRCSTPPISVGMWNARSRPTWAPSSSSTTKLNTPMRLQATSHWR